MVDSEACQWDGNADLYGVGVRVGLYAQWVATLLTTVFDSRSERGLRTANLIIQLAIFLGMCTESTDTNSHPAASVITQFLLCGSLSSVTGDGISHLRSLSGVARVAFYIALSAYGCWFWYVGIDVMRRRSDDASCGEIAFLGGTTFDGWFRVLGKVLAVLGLITCVVLLGYWAYLVVRRFRGGFEHGIVANEDAHGGKGRPRIELALLALSVGLIVLSAVTVEYLIRVNRVQGVGRADLDSVGQLIPLIAGCMGSALVVWKIVMHGLFVKKRCVYLFGFHL